MLLDWMMKEDYSKLKEKAGHCERTNMPRKAENQEEEDALLRCCRLIMKIMLFTVGHPYH